MLTNFRLRMGRERLSRWVLWFSVGIALFLAQIIVGESVSTTGPSKFDEGRDGVYGSRRYLTNHGIGWKITDDVHGMSTNTSSWMEDINQESAGWSPAMKSISDRVFCLASGEDYNWPVLNLKQPRTILGIILGGIGAGLSSAGGLGGGGLFVPLFNLLLQFDPKTSAALSNFVIVGGSTVNLWINLQQNHPVQVHKPVIDFDVLLLMQPTMLLGISIGVILNIVLPAWLITASLAVVLGYMTIHSFNVGFKRWARETRQNDARSLEAPSSILAVTSDKEEEVATVPSLPFYRDASQPLLNAAAESTEKRVLYPWTKIGILILVWLCFFAVQVLRGGKGGSSIFGLRQCGLGYWLVTLTQVPLALMCTLWTISQLRTPSKEHHGPYDIHEMGYVLGPEAGTLFPRIALVSGVLGGMLGIGGGMIINPLLFTVGMLPQVTAATCASMVFFSSSMSVIQYWLMGRIPVNYAVISGVLCTIFSWVGIKIVHKAIDKYNRASLIVFSVAAVMGVSAVFMVGFGGWDVWQDYEAGSYMGFHYPC